MTRKVVRDDQDEKTGTSRPGWDVLVRDGGPGAGLAGHLLLPHEPTHPLNLLDLLFYNIKLVSAYAVGKVDISAHNKFGPWQCCHKFDLYKIGP